MSDIGDKEVTESWISVDIYRVNAERISESSFLSKKAQSRRKKQTQGFLAVPFRKQKTEHVEMIPQESGWLTLLSHQSHRVLNGQGIACELEPGLRPVVQTTYYCLTAVNSSSFTISLIRFQPKFPLLG